MRNGIAGINEIADCQCKSFNMWGQHIAGDGHKQDAEIDN